MARYFHVSTNQATYGPTGGYNIFAGVHTTRGFITECFAEDRTWDLRGVEEMFLELDQELDLFEEGKWVELVRRFGSGDAEGGKGELSEERKKKLSGRVDKRRKSAWENVERSINHWDSFFRNYEKYKHVGEVIHRDTSGDLVRKVCANALKQRPNSRCFFFSCEVEGNLESQYQPESWPRTPPKKKIDQPFGQYTFVWWWHN